MNPLLISDHIRIYPQLITLVFNVLDGGDYEFT